MINFDKPTLTFYPDGFKVTCKKKRLKKVMETMEGRT